MFLVLAFLLQDVDRVCADDPAVRAAVREEIRKSADKPALVKALRDRETRAAAAIALGLLEAPEARDALATLGRDRDPAVRARAYEAIGWISDAPVELLFDGLSDYDPRAAYAAARALSRRDPAKVQARLHAIVENMIAARKRETRYLAAVLALEGLAPGTQWYALYTSMAESEPAVASAAALALAQVEKLDAPRESGVDFASGFRAALAREDLKEDARAMAAAQWIRFAPPGRTDLFALLRDRDAPVREAARRALDREAFTKLDVGALVELPADAWVEKKLRELSGADADWRAWWDRNRETALAEVVAKSIDRGVSLLRSRLQADGTWKDRYGHAGLTALAVYTLLKCGATPEELAKPLDFIAKCPLDGEPLEGGTYRASAIAMACAEASSVAKGDVGARYRKRAIEAAAYLAKSQRRGGSWGYHERDVNYVDNSNAQFALLGLRAAQNVGAKVATSTWTRAAEHFASSQLADGGWGYTREQSYGSMTAAGLCGLMLARSSSKERPVGDFLADRDVAGALAWIEKNWSLEGHRYRAGGVGSGIGSAYYWLWTFERCALVADVRRVAGRDWWFDGATYVVGRQSAAGEWTGPEGLAAHCFAILFLKRAYVPVASEPK